ncbi:MAG TPA: hypothetical protein VKX28_33835 [Xanthobacteraceae bacterium]|nr:hypothetical protein [Xanthobacteraceae bacterium]
MTAEAVDKRDLTERSQTGPNEAKRARTKPNGPNEAKRPERSQTARTKPNGPNEAKFEMPIASIGELRRKSKLENRMMSVDPRRGQPVTNFGSVTQLG